MHGRVLSLTMGPMRVASELAPEPLRMASGFRNFIETPTEGEIFKVDGKPVDGSQACRERLQSLMAGVARRMERGYEWEAALPGAIEIGDNPRIPSGYTYLLQLVAHDLVQSALSLAETHDKTAALANYRLSPLRLDTIYGGGPDVCPFAYVNDVPNPAIPRTRLRLGRISMAGRAPDECPFRDVARVGVSQREAPTISNIDEPAVGLTDTLLADPRNDDHAILSQLATLFHLLHNGLLAKLSDGSGSSIAARYGHFVLARAAVARVYRNIVEKDLLCRFLHPRVYKVYEAADGANLDRWDDRVPLEFSHGAFRCGHAMVRGEYRINSNTALATSAALEQNSLRRPNLMPISERWVVQWSRFFVVDGSQPNLSRRIAPEYTNALLDNSLFGVIDDSAKAGLAYRDLLSSGLAGLWSVPRLIQKIRGTAPFDQLLPEFEQKWPDRIEHWLAAHREGTGLSDGDIKTLRADPPLPMFLLYEAATETGGRSLGTLGSIIVAEVLFGALRQRAIGAPVDVSARETLLALAERADPLARLLHITKMQDLVVFVAKSLDQRDQLPAFI
jgi:hypothetical protein